MSDYYDEMGWIPLPEGTAPNHLLEMARFLRDGGILDLQSQQEILAPPASKTALEELKEVNIMSNEGKQSCPVCLKEFEVGNIVKQMPCQHSFHKECLEPWLKQTNSCPLCRHELPTDNEDYELYRKEKLRAVERAKDLEILHNAMYQ